jgi:protease I
MKTRALSGRKVAVLAAPGVEQSELTAPREALLREGAHVDIVSLKKDTVRAWNHDDWGMTFEVDRHIDQADPAEYDALVLPGGVMNPDTLRMDHRAVDFARSFMSASKPVAAICHGPWLLVEADAVKGRNVTSYPSLRTDLTNAQANWTDAQVVVDGNLITSRRPDDLPAFCHALIDLVTRTAAHAAAE